MPIATFETELRAPAYDLRRKLRGLHMGLLVGLLSTTLATGGCAASGPQFRRRVTSEYAPGGTVAVLGVFIDGRMDTNAWNDRGATLLPIDACPAGYSADLVANDPSLASATDDYVRANGVTDALLAQFATLTKADTLLLFSIAGHPPVQTGPTVVTPKVVVPGQMTRTASTYDVHRPTDGSVFQVTASLYSVRTGREIGELDMTADHDVDGALKAFGRRLKVDLPITACGAWSADTRGLDAAKLRALKE